MEDTESFSLSLFNLASNSDLVIKSVGSSAVLDGRLVAERLPTLALPTLAFMALTLVRQSPARQLVE